MGELRKIQIDLEEHPAHYEVGIGDVIQCFVDFRLHPSTIVDAIVVFVGGQPNNQLTISCSAPNAVATAREADPWDPKCAKRPNKQPIPVSLPPIYSMLRIPNQAKIARPSPFPYQSA